MTVTKSGISQPGVLLVGTPAQEANMKRNAKQNIQAAYSLLYGDLA